MLPWLLFAAVLVATAASLHKDRRMASPEPVTIRAVRLHHIAQFAVAAIALWNAIASDNESREYQSALRNNAMASELVHHRSATMAAYVDYILAGTPAEKEAAIAKLKGIASEIDRAHLKYGARMPKDAIEWAKMTREADGTAGFDELLQGKNYLGFSRSYIIEVHQRLTESARKLQ